MLTTALRRLGLAGPAPATRPEAPAGPAPYAAGESTTAAQANVLVVDDDPDIRELIAVKLRRAGYAAAGAPDGPTALSILRQWPPDLVVLDVMMPGQSGIEVCREIRQHPPTAGVPVILLTARTSAAFAYAGVATGADRHMLKPFSPRELVQEVADLLDRAA